MSIEWIDVKTRVPDNRREVLTWGRFTVFGYERSGPNGWFLGVTKFNPCCDGGRFDSEAFGRFAHRGVTHWAEITGP
jgi:hypothetical protein